MAEPAISKSANILLCCARAHPEPERVRRLAALLETPVDWPEVLELAAWHGTVPLLYRNLSRNHAAAVPTEILATLHERFYAAASRNLFMTAELVRLLRLFRERGIAAAPLKGPALAHAVYENLALREFADLDILVRRGDVARVKDLLISLDYTPQLRLDGSGQTAFLDSNYELCFARAGSSDIEIHWGFQEEKFLGAEVSPEGWWRGLEPLELGGERIEAPRREDLLLYLCAHGAKHVWNRLKWITDVAELLANSPAIDWDELLASVDASGAERLLLLGVYLAHALLGAALPKPLESRISGEPALATLAALARESLWRGQPGVIGNALFHLKLRPRWRDKMRYCVRNILVPTAGEWKLIALPERLSFLYYPMRPLRLLGTYGLAPLKRFFE